jgi:formamidopyrimidine-DNA glycosylase
MPELPEVETTRRGIEPFLLDKQIQSVLVHKRSLRWPIPKAIEQLSTSPILHVGRRGKYILLANSHGTAIIHLGMSGSLRIDKQNSPRRKHDHVELFLNHKQVIRFHDPRRFGCMLWHEGPIEQHALLEKLGPEPLSNHFNDEYLFAATRKRKVAIKNLIMNSHVVVGVGNIYASEALFLSGIRPGKAAMRISRVEATRLCQQIRTVLQKSIDQGGTTLRDFINSDGEPGYFAQSLNVYGKEGEPCLVCKSAIKQKIMGQRSTFYCSSCQS